MSKTTCKAGTCWCGTIFPGVLVPFERLEAGGQLVQLSVLLVLHSMMEEVTNPVQLLVAQVAIGTEVEGQRGEFNVDAATSSAWDGNRQLTWRVRRIFLLKLRFFKSGCVAVTCARAPLQLSEASLHERKLPAHRVRDLHHVKLQLVAHLHPLTGHALSGQHHGDRGATEGGGREGAVTKMKVAKQEQSHRKV